MWWMTRFSLKIHKNRNPKLDSCSPQDHHHLGWNWVALQGLQCSFAIPISCPLARPINLAPYGFRTIPLDLVGFLKPMFCEWGWSEYIITANDDFQIPKDLVQSILEWHTAVVDGFHKFRFLGIRIRPRGFMIPCWGDLSLRSPSDSVPWSLENGSSWSWCFVFCFGLFNFLSRVSWFDLSFLGAFSSLIIINNNHAESSLGWKILYSWANI